MKLEIEMGMLVSKMGWNRKFRNSKFVSA